ncbi:MAG: hypothetical protein LBQ62_07405 [Candidatus Accumulibacter sp.]|jgi:hypothetical protein|nr:hypothetical protein [Accumulibacter sp.]
MLAGHRRYAHVTPLRCDGLNPGLLGMSKVISEDALRNALKRLPEAAGTAWLDGHLTDSIAPLLDAPWILDTDTTLKPLHGHQEGAAIGDNPFAKDTCFSGLVMTNTRRKSRIVGIDFFGVASTRMAA